MDVVKEALCEMTSTSTETSEFETAAMGVLSKKLEEIIKRADGAEKAKVQEMLDSCKERIATTMAQVEITKMMMELISK